MSADCWTGTTGSRAAAGVAGARSAALEAVVRVQHHRRARCDREAGSSVSHDHTRAVARRRRASPDRDRQWLAGLRPWRCRAACQALPRAKRHSQPAERAVRRRHHANAADGFGDRTAGARGPQQQPASLGVANDICRSPRHSGATWRQFGTPSGWSTPSGLSPDQHRSSTMSGGIPTVSPSPTIAWCLWTTARSSSGGRTTGMATAIRS